MTPEPYTLHVGDCLDVLREMPSDSVDAVVTDPPYGLSKEPDIADVLRHWLNGDDYKHRGLGGFMGKSWDSFVPGPAVWREAVRVLKPGGHLLAFSGTRTADLLGIALRLAGFEIRDEILSLGPRVYWLYGSGFPKSLDVGKAIDRRGGNPHLAAEIGEAIRKARQTRGWTVGRADEHFCGGTTNWSWFEGRPSGQRPPTPGTFARIVAEWPELAPLADAVTEAEREVVGEAPWTNSVHHFQPGEDHAQRVQLDLTAPATEAARQWSGFGTALKPAHEAILVARKPLAAPNVASQVLATGTGALNIDGCRVGTADDLNGGAYTNGRRPRAMAPGGASRSAQPGEYSQPSGRWPANLVLAHSESCNGECVEGCPVAELDRQSGEAGATGGPASGRRYGYQGEYDHSVYGDYKDRKIWAHGDSGGASRFFYTAKASTRERNEGLPPGMVNRHPTVKPTQLARWLVRLCVPPGGICLDPFAGSGSIGVAAIQEGFYFIGIEKDEESYRIAEARIAHAASRPAQQELTV